MTFAKKITYFPQLARGTCGVCVYMNVLHTSLSYIPFMISHLKMWYMMRLLKYSTSFIPSIVLFLKFILCDT